MRIFDKMFVFFFVSPKTCVSVTAGVFGLLPNVQTIVVQKSRFVLIFVFKIHQQHRTVRCLVGRTCQNSDADRSSEAGRQYQGGIFSTSYYI